MSDIITRDENGDLAVRTVVATEDTTQSQYDDLYARTTDGKRALRVVGGGSGGGAVSTVNDQTGDVVLTGSDINATLTNGDVESTATITEHLQTLKNDDRELGDAIQGIQEKIPGDASTENPLATQSKLNEYLPLTGGSVDGALNINGSSGVALSAVFLRLKNSAFLQMLSNGRAAIGYSNSILVFLGNIIPQFNHAYSLGTQTVAWKSVFVPIINNGADINVPTTGGTMVVSTNDADATTGMVLTKTDNGAAWTEPTGGAKITMTTFGG